MAMTIEELNSLLNRTGWQTALDKETGVPKIVTYRGDMSVSYVHPERFLAELNKQGLELNNDMQIVPGKGKEQGAKKKEEHKPPKNEIPGPRPDPSPCYTAAELEALPRKKLQNIAKKHDIPANAKTEELREKLIGKPK